MKNSLTLLLISFVIYSCKTASEETEGKQSVEIIEIDSTFKGQTLLTEFDTLQQEVQFKFPLIVENNNPLFKKINEAIQLRTQQTLLNYSEDELDSTAVKRISLRQAAEDFFKEANDMRREDNLSPAFAYMWTFYLEADTLFLDENRLTIEISSSIYTGGAHPNSGIEIINFDVKTGNEIEIEKLITGSTFPTIVKECFIKNETEFMKKENFEFNLSDYFLSEGEFPIPSAMGFTKEGIKCVYSPYEIASYARGPIEFIIPYEKLKGVLKI